MSKVASRKRYALDQSVFYKLTSPRRLANVLRISLDDLQALLDCNKNYNVFEIERDGRKRTVEEPKARLQQLHKRIHSLLSRIETPEYLHSAIKGRSYRTNATAHVGRGAMVKIDVRSFFRSVRQVAVFGFFRNHLKCDADVAAMLAKLLTIDGHLPTGSSASPIISYYAHKAMFDAIDNLASEAGLRMTCYVDDMSISGRSATRQLLYQVRRIIARQGLKSHKAHFFPTNRPKVVTGVVVTDLGVKLPNRRHRKINEEYQSYVGTSSAEEKLKILRRLVSRVYEAAQIDPTWTPRAQSLVAERRKLERDIGPVASTPVRRQG